MALSYTISFAWNCCIGIFISVSCMHVLLHDWQSLECVMKQRGGSLCWYTTYWRQEWPTGASESSTIGRNQLRTSTKDLSFTA